MLQTFLLSPFLVLKIHFSNTIWCKKCTYLTCFYLFKQRIVNSFIGISPARVPPTYPHCVRRIIIKYLSNNILDFNAQAMTRQKYHYLCSLRPAITNYNSIQEIPTYQILHSFLYLIWLLNFQCSIWELEEFINSSNSLP